MIGLGSNRLTVCRRGGMSVTQAGRGGMEWLAGIRDPIWASPYSAQATAALKAAFTAAQWQTIKAYGFAHPEYVNAINLFAPEDTHIMYSLIPSLGYKRWIIGDGKAYIDTGWTATTNSVEVEIEFMLVNNIYNGYILFGSGTRNDTNWCINPYNYRDSTLRSYVGNSGEIDTQIITQNVEYHNIYKADNGVYTRITDGVEVSRVNYTNTIVNGQNLYIFADNAESRVLFMSNYNLKRFIIRDVRTLDFIPCKHNEQNGVVDLLAGTWHGNSNTQGSFTISETPAS